MPARPVHLKRSNAGFKRLPWNRTLTQRMDDLTALFGGESLLKQQSSVTDEKLRKLKGKKQKQEIVRLLPTKSLGCLSMDNPLRQACIKAYLHPYFDRIVLFLIILNSAFLAANDPTTSNDDEVTDVTEFIFNSAFTVEMLIKIIALSAHTGPLSYFEDGWNRLDFGVVCLGWLPFLVVAASGTSVGNFTAIRAVRILKVFKTVTGVEGMRRLVSTLIDATAKLVNVMYLLTFIFFIFGILGIQMFMGVLRQRCVGTAEGLNEYPIDAANFTTGDRICSTENLGYQCHDEVAYVPISSQRYTEEPIPQDLLKCSVHDPVRDQLIANPGNGFIGFDNALMAFLTIFTSISLEGWVGVMYDLMDAKGPAVVIYFVLLVLVGAWFVINLVVAVIYDAYTRYDTQEDEMKRQAQLLQRQRSKQHLTNAAKHPAYLKHPLHRFRLWSKWTAACRAIVQHKYFNPAITAAILINTVLLSAEHKDQSDEFTFALNVCNLIFVVIFDVEVLVKSAALGMRLYLRDKFNRFDMLIAISGTIETAFLDQYGINLTVLRALRLLRTLKLVQHWNSLRSLITTVMRSGPGLAYFSCILLLFIFVAALCGMEFYGGQFNRDNGFKETPRANFDSLVMALLASFQVITGENWNEIMYDSMRINGAIGAVFFVIIFVFGNYIALNLFLAILLDNFSKTSDDTALTYYQVLERENDVMRIVNFFRRTISDTKVRIQQFTSSRGSMFTSKEWRSSFRKSVSAAVSRTSAAPVKLTKGIAARRRTRIDPNNPDEVQMERRTIMAGDGGMDAALSAAAAVAADALEGNDDDGGDDGNIGTGTSTSASVALAATPKKPSSDSSDKVAQKGGGHREHASATDKHHHRHSHHHHHHRHSRHHHHHRQSHHRHHDDRQQQHKQQHTVSLPQRHLATGAASAASASSPEQTDYPSPASVTKGTTDEASTGSATPGPTERQVLDLQRVHRDGSIGEQPAAATFRGGADKSGVQRSPSPTGSEPPPAWWQKLAGQSSSPQPTGSGMKRTTVAPEPAEPTVLLPKSGKTLTPAPVQRSSDGGGAGSASVAPAPSSTGNSSRSSSIGDHSKMADAIQKPLQQRQPSRIVGTVAHKTRMPLPLLAHLHSLGQRQRHKRDHDHGEDEHEHEQEDHHTHAEFHKPTEESEAHHISTMSGEQLTDVVESVMEKVVASEHKRGYRTFVECFSGKELVDALLEHSFTFHKWGALALGQSLLQHKLMAPVYLSSRAHRAAAGQAVRVASGETNFGSRLAQLALAKEGHNHQREALIDDRINRHEDEMKDTTESSEALGGIAPTAEASLVGDTAAADKEQQQQQPQLQQQQHQGQPSNGDQRRVHRHQSRHQRHRHRHDHRRQHRHTQDSQGAGRNQRIQAQYSDEEGENTARRTGSVALDHGSVVSDTVAVEVTGPLEAPPLSVFDARPNRPRGSCDLPSSDTYSASMPSPGVGSSEIAAASQKTDKQPTSQPQHHDQHGSHHHHHDHHHHHHHHEQHGEQQQPSSHIRAKQVFTFHPPPSKDAVSDQPMDVVRDHTVAQAVRGATFAMDPEALMSTDTQVREEAEAYSLAMSVAGYDPKAAQAMESAMIADQKRHRPGGADAIDEALQHANLFQVQIHDLRKKHRHNRHRHRRHRRRRRKHREMRGKRCADQGSGMSESSQRRNSGAAARRLNNIHGGDRNSNDSAKPTGHVAMGQSVSGVSALAKNPPQQHAVAENPQEPDNTTTTTTTMSQQNGVAGTDNGTTTITTTTTNNNNNTDDGNNNRGRHTEAPQRGRKASVVERLADALHASSFVGVGGDKNENRLRKSRRQSSHRSSLVNRIAGFGRKHGGRSRRGRRRGSRAASSSRSGNESGSESRSSGSDEDGDSDDDDPGSESHSSGSSRESESSTTRSGSDRSSASWSGDSRSHSGSSQSSRGSGSYDSDCSTCNSGSRSSCSSTGSDTPRAEGLGSLTRWGSRRRNLMRLSSRLSRQITGGGSSQRSSRSSSRSSSARRLGVEDSVGSDSNCVEMHARHGKLPPVKSSRRALDGSALDGFEQRDRGESDVLAPPSDGSANSALGDHHRKRAIGDSMRSHGGGSRNSGAEQNTSRFHSFRSMRRKRSISSRSRTRSSTALSRKNRNGKLDPGIGTARAAAALPKVFADDWSLYRFVSENTQVSEMIRQSTQSTGRLMEKKRMQLEEKRQEMARGVSLNLFSSKNRVRRACIEIVTSGPFEMVILVLITLSSVLLALDEPGLNRHSVLGQIVDTADLVLTVCFVAEMMLKVIAMGFYRTPNAYLKDGWNLLDFLIVCVSVLTLALQSLDLSFLKSLRALRALRPLRMVSRNPGMKMVVNAIIMAMPLVANVCLVVMVFFLVFSILGGALFRGTFEYCHGMVPGEASSVFTDEFKYLLDRGDCFGERFSEEQNSNVTLEWRTHPFTFDDVGSSMITLFELANMEQWPLIMYAGIDATAEGKHPVKNNNLAAALFFVVFITVGGFFVVNLFVGVVINKFAEIKSRGTSLFLTPGQVQWLDTLKSVLNAKPAAPPLPPDGALECLRVPVYKMIMNPRFEIAIMVAISVNILTMAMEHYRMSDTWTQLLNGLDIAFGSIFTAELVLKIFGLGFRQYFNSPWNVFDFLIVFFAIFALTGEAGLFDVTILRVFRMARIFKLLKTSKSLRIMFETLFFSLTSLINVGSLLLLEFFVYSVMGMNLFGEVRRDGVFLTSKNNFESFSGSMMTLFRSSTGEAWNEVMHHLRQEGHPEAVPYFISFVVFCNYMMLNLFIAVILENFNTAQAADQKLQAAHLESFNESWGAIQAELQTPEKYFLPSYCLPKLLNTMLPPMGFNGTKLVEFSRGTTAERNTYSRFIMNFIRDLHLFEDEAGRIFFVETLSAVVRRQFRLDDVESRRFDQDQLDEIQAELARSAGDKLRERMVKHMEHHHAEVDVSPAFNAATGIQMVFRGRQARKRMQKTRMRVKQALSMKNIISKVGHSEATSFLVPHSVLERIDREEMAAKEKMLTEGLGQQMAGRAVMRLAAKQSVRQRQRNSKRGTFGGEQLSDDDEEAATLAEVEGDATFVQEVRDRMNAEDADDTIAWAELVPEGTALGAGQQEADSNTNGETAQTLVDVEMHNRSTVIADSGSAGVATTTSCSTSMAKPGSVCAEAGKSGSDAAVKLTPQPGTQGTPEAQGVEKGDVPAMNPPVGSASTTVELTTVEGVRQLEAPSSSALAEPVSEQLPASPIPVSHGKDGAGAVSATAHPEGLAQDAAVAPPIASTVPQQATAETPLVGGQRGSSVPSTAAADTPLDVRVATIREAEDNTNAGAEIASNSLPRPYPLTPGGSEREPVSPTAGEAAGDASGAAGTAKPSAAAKGLTSKQTSQRKKKKTTKSTAGLKKKKGKRKST